MVEARALATALADRWLDRLRDEWTDARRLPHLGAHPVYAAAGAVRQAALVREVADLETRLVTLARESAYLGAALHERMQTWSGRVAGLFRLVGTRADAEARATDALAPLDLSLAEVLEAPRPLLTADEFYRWVPRHDRGAASPAVRLARASALRRFANPQFRHRAAAATDAAAVTCVDRVDALLHLVERNATVVAPFLRAGARLLGRNLRAPALMRRLSSSLESADSTSALAGLVLLGSDDAAAVARALLERSDRPDLQVDGLYALLVLGELDLTTLPSAVTRSPAVAVRQAVRTAVFAVRDGERLPRRLL